MTRISLFVPNMLLNTNQPSPSLRSEVMPDVKMFLLLNYCSHLVATVSTLLDRALPQPLEGTMSASQWRLKRSRDANRFTVNAPQNGIKQKVSTGDLNSANFCCVLSAGRLLS